MLIHACMPTLFRQQPGPKLLSFDMLVLEISLVYLVIRVGLFKVKGSLLWAAYSSLYSESLTTAVKVSKVMP